MARPSPPPLLGRNDSSSLFWGAGAERSGDNALVSFTHEVRLHRKVPAIQIDRRSPFPWGRGLGEGELSSNCIVPIRSIGGERDLSSHRLPPVNFRRHHGPNHKIPGAGLEVWFQARQETSVRAGSGPVKSVSTTHGSDP